VRRNTLTIPMHLGLRGEFRAVVHDGDGVPKRETPYNKNIITAGGLNYFFTGAETAGFCVAGDGNATPSMSDVTLDNYLGKMTTHLGVTGSVNNDPLSGPLWISSEARIQFVPGAFGGSSVNIAEAGFTYGPGALGAVDASTPLFNRGLLVDSLGNPTTVAVAPTEYLDLFWRYTVNIPDNVVGTVVIDVDGVPTNFDFTVRPANLTPVASASVAPWGYMVVLGGSFPNKNAFMPNGVTNPASNTLLNNSMASASGLLEPSTDWPSTTAIMRPTSATPQAYVFGDFFKDIEFIWTLGQGNVVGGIRTLLIYLGWTCWQIEFDPLLPKTDLKQLNITFRISANNA
jgi:hypothetical protein